MADLKISQLTSATLPLAGTEVLPIVQSSTTKKVAVSDLTAGRAVSALSMTLTNALAVTSGGTGLSSVAQGDLLYGSAANTLAALAKNTTATRYLSNTGTSNNPAWAQVNLTNGVTGTLPTGNGGTGLTSFTANGLVYASSTSALATSASLTWNGTVFAIGAAGNAFSFTSTTSSTAYNAAQYSNSGGSIYWGVDNSAGTAFNGLAYAGVIGTSNATAFEIFTNNAVRQTWHSSGGVSIGNTTDPGAGNLNVDGPTLKVGTTSQYNSTANIGVFSWSSASNAGGEGGYVFVNTSTSANSDPNPVLLIHKGSTTTTSSARFVQFFANGASQPMGGIVGNGATNVQFVSLSDEREKENIQPVTGALNRLMQIQVCSFDRKGSGDHVKAGFIAQNVLPVYPEYVVENAANADDDPRYGITGGMSAGYVAELTAAIQEQQAMINDLKQKLEQYIAKN